MLDRLLLRQVQAELVLNLLMHVSVFDIRDVGVHHERNQVEEKVGALPEDAKRRKAEVFKACVV